MAKPKELSTVAARDDFSDFLNRVAYGKERIILTRRGKPVAVAIPIEDFEALKKGELH